MFRKVMNRSPRDQTCLKHEIFEDQFSLYGPSIQILHPNSGNILFKVSFGIRLVNASLSTELLSVSVSWGNGAYAIASYVFMSVCLCPFAAIFEPLGQNQGKFDRERERYLTDNHIPVHFVKGGTEEEERGHRSITPLGKVECLLMLY